MEDAAVVPSSSNASSGVFMGPGELLSRSWNIFKSKWQVLVLISLVPVAIALLLAVVAFVVALSVGLTGSLNKDALAGILAVGFFVLIPVVLILYIGILIVSSWAQLAMLVVISHADEKIGVQQAFAMAKSKLLKYIITSIVVGVFVTAGVFFFLIPGLIIGIWFAFALFVVLEEGKSGLTAALTSRGYVRGRGLGVLGRFLVLGALSFGIALCIVIVQSLVVGFSKDSSASALMFLSPVLSLLSNVISYILGILGTIYSYLMYRNLRELHGGEVVIQPTTRTKYMIFGVLGFIIGLLVFGSLIVSAVTGIMNSRNVVPPATNLEDQMMQQYETRPTDEELDSTFDQQDLNQYEEDYGSTPDSTDSAEESI